MQNLWGSIKGKSLKEIWNGSGELKDIPNILSLDSAEQVISDWVNWKKISKPSDTIDDFVASTKELSNAVDGNVFKNYITLLDGASASAEGYAEATTKAAESAIKFNSSLGSQGLKGILANAGKSILTLGANIATLAVALGTIHLIFTTIDNIVNRQQKLIDKGEEARKTIEETYGSFSKGKTSIDNLGKSFADSEDDIKNTEDAIESIGKKYEEFRKGVNEFNNENESLSTEGYKDYIELSNQLAEQFPSLVAGYDSQGNAILNLGNSAEEATSKLKELYAAQQMSANVEIGSKLNDTYAGVNASVDQLLEKRKEYNEQIESLSLPNFDLSSLTKGITFTDINERNSLVDYLTKNGIPVSTDEFANENNQIVYTITPSIDFENLDSDQKQSLEAQLQIYNEDAQRKINDLRNKQSANDMMIRDQWNSMIEPISNYLNTAETFTNLTQDLQSSIISNLSNIDIAALGDNYGGDVKAFLYEEYLMPLSELSKPMQEKLSNIFKLDPDSMTMSNYLTTIQDTFEEVFGSRNSSFYKKLGFDDFFSEKLNMSKAVKEAVTDSKDLVKELTAGDLEIAYDLVTNDKFSGTFEELKAKIEEAKALGAAGIDIYANPKFDAIAKADETENAGDDYVKAKKYLEEAKEMYDNNLIGTDDFKSRAAYFSPTGADDPANFIENYEKASKYLTDDSSGVEAFLNDLESKGYATFETLSDGTKKWSYDIKDLEEASQNMGMGFEFFMDMFGRLEDYGFHNNFVGSVEQGAQRITDLTSELVKEQAKLSEMETTGMYTTVDENGNETKTVANQTALDAQREKVNLLKQDIIETQAAMDSLVSRSAEEYNNQIENAKQSINSMAEERQKILDENTFGENTQAVADAMEEQINAWASQYHLELNAELKVEDNGALEEKIRRAKELVAILKGETPTNAVSNPTNVDLNNRPVVQESKVTGNKEDTGYATVFSQAFSNEDETKTVVVTPILPNGDVLSDDELGTYVDQLLDGNEIDANIHLATFDGEDSVKQANDYSQALHEVQQAYYGEDEALKEVLSTLQEKSAAELRDINLSDGKYSDGEQELETMLNTLGLTYDQASALITVLEQMGLVDTSLNIDTEGAQTELDTISTELSELSKEELIELGFEVSGDGLTPEEIKKQIPDIDPIPLQTKLENPTNGEIDTGSAEATIDADNTPGKEKGDELKDYVESLNPTMDIDANNSPAKEKVDEVKEYAEAQDAVMTIDGETSAADSAIGETKGKADSSTGTMTIDGDNNPAISATNDAVGYINSSSGDITVNGNVSQLASDIDTECAKPRQVTVHASVTGLNFGGGNGRDFLNGNAHSHGTPMITSARFNDGYLGTAYANGTWGEKQNTQALIGELGPELVVRGNHFFTVGDNGAEMVNLKKGDIVFNHLQTKEIFTKGYVNSRGKALATGNARGAGTGTGGGTIGGNKHTASSSTSKVSTLNDSINKLGNTSTSSTKKISKLETALKKIDKLFDWIEVKLDRVQRNIDYNTAASENQVGYESKNAHITTAQNYTQQLIDANNAGAKEYKAQADKVAKQVGLSNDLKNKVNNGTIKIQELSEDDKKRVDAYKQWYDKMLDCVQASEELKASQRELAQTKLDNITDQYEAFLSHLEHQADLINGFIDQSEMKGYVESAKYYEALMTNTVSQRTDLEKKRAALMASLQESMNSGVIQKDSVEWANMQSQINDTSKAIQDADSNLLKFSNKIREIQWARFDMGQEAISRITDETEFLIKLMSNDDLFDDKGNTTEQGMATFGLRGVNYNTYMEQAQKYRDEMLKINSQIAKDPNNTTLLKRREELIDLQRDSILAAEEEKQAIKDLVKDGIDKQLSSLQELIDKYKDALNSASDLADYQKDVADQTSEIARLQKQLQAFGNDDSEEGRLRAQKTKNDLKEAQDNLKETEYDRYISDQENLLDNLYTEYEEILNERLDNIDQLISDTITSINDNSGIIGDTLREEVGNVGTTLSTSLDSLWGEKGTATTVLSTFAGDFATRATTLQSAIDRIVTGVENLGKTSDTQAQTDVNSTAAGGGSNPVVDEVQTPSGGNDTPEAEAPKTNKILSIIQSGKKRSKKLTAKEKKDHNKLWEYLVSKYGYAPNNSIYTKLAKELNVKVSKTVTTKQKWKILDALKAKKYASGTKYVKKDEWANINEQGAEILTLPDGSILTPLKKGSGVINNPNTEKLLGLADNYDTLQRIASSVDTGSLFNRGVGLNGVALAGNKGDTNVNSNITFNLPNIYTPEDFMSYITHNKKAQQALNDMIISPLNGGSSLKKYRNGY